MNPTPTPPPPGIAPVALAYMLGNLAARGGGAVPGRMIALANALHETGDLEPLLADLDPALASTLTTLLNVEHSRAKFGVRRAVTG